ncbi:hypothetical protein DID75_00430 [Candidatus Marinamargulisbacteria bacterium SCGC AG-410-N11]|nr:hypothetical protein DID75_00430 [Candidatus Marinamargulisbacteria bacterium SCGC AG-410-N11]
MDIKSYDDIEVPERFVSFIVFEPASIRVNPIDILLVGDKVPLFFEEIQNKLLEREQTLKENILQNQFNKIGQMLSLLKNYDNVIITRFFDRIWRRYSYISHLGEMFVNLKTYKEFLPEVTDVSDIITQRFDDEDLTELIEAGEEDNAEDENVVDNETVAQKKEK